MNVAIYIACFEEYLRRASANVIGGGELVSYVSEKTSDTIVLELSFYYVNDGRKTVGINVQNNTRLIESVPNDKKHSTKEKRKKKLLHAKEITTNTNH